METNHTSDFLNWDEGVKLIDMLISERNYRTALFIGSGMYSGLRVSDLLRLTWSDLEGKAIRIAEKKTKKVREITISDKYRNVINQCISIKSDCPLLFTNARQTSLSTQYLNTLLKGLKDKYKWITCQNFSCHSLRKAFGRHVYELNNKSEDSLVMLSEILNHSSIALTRRYLGITRSEIANVYLNL
jgi:integrase